MSDPMVEVRPWRRFHVRITGLYAVAVLGVLTLASTWTWRSAVDWQTQALRGRLLNTAVAVAGSVPAGDLSSVATPGLRDRFAALGAIDPDLRGLYVLRTTDRPGRLAFVVDWARDPVDEAAAGEPYDATALPVMLAGLRGPVVESELYRDDWGWTLSSYAPILGADGVAVGLVGVDVADTRIARLQRDVFVRTLVTWLLSAGLVGLAALVVARSVRDPLGRTIRATSAIAQGKLETRLALDRTDEFGVLGRHFDAMASGLQDRELIRGTFGRYVSEEVAAELLAMPGGPTLGGREVECTIVFSDLRGYSSVSEGMTPTDLVSLLNAYLAGMQGVIDAHQGTVIEFLGDAILTVFGAPVERPGHAEAAVRCAIGMREAMARLNREWAASGVASAWTSVGMPELTHRVGIHTGRAVAGNLGSATRMKFAVIGDAVNVASRLEGLATQHGTDVLLSEQTLAGLSAELRRRCVARGAAEVKGRQRSVRVYSLA